MLDKGDTRSQKLSSDHSQGATQHPFIHSGDTLTAVSHARDAKTRCNVPRKDLQPHVSRHLHPDSRLDNSAALFDTEHLP